MTNRLKDLNVSMVYICNTVKYVRFFESQLQDFKNYVKREKIEYKGLWSWICQLGEISPT